MKDYPLEAKSVVLETSRSELDLFNDARTWILDNFSNSAARLSTSSTSNMITLPVSEKYKSFKNPLSPLAKEDNIGSLEFTIVIEFKEGRMRWSTRDVKLRYQTNNGYDFYSDHSTPYGGKYLAGYGPYRKEGSELYQKYLSMLENGMKQVVSGKLASFDW